MICPLGDPTQDPTSIPRATRRSDPTFYSSSTRLGIVKTIRRPAVRAVAGRCSLFMRIVEHLQSGRNVRHVTDLAFLVRHLGSSDT
jgi:hypothetical protein